MSTRIDILVSERVGTGSKLIRNDNYL